MTTPLSLEYRTISLTQGQSAVVDAKHYDRLNQWNWYAWWNKRTKSYYARRNQNCSDGTRKTVWMHREVLLITESKDLRGDHRRPDDTLVNTEENLRVATHTQNNQNARIRSDNTTGLKGVSYDKKSNSYSSSICVKGNVKRLGLFASKEEAHLAYCYAAHHLRGEFARFE